MSTYSITDFKAGDRIEVHPATDRWMRGDRYATVVRVGRKNLMVKFDRSGLQRSWSPANVYGIDDRVMFEALKFWNGSDGDINESLTGECMCDFEGNVVSGCDHS